MSEAAMPVPQWWRSIARHCTLCDISGKRNYGRRKLDKLIWGIHIQSSEAMVFSASLLGTEV